ncbi:hypothetical protein [Sphingomonas sp.]|uniref:hypothetical protein n=1 Tax=Sphingomonas sp. TaxID=28214 RepID=UPI0017C96849|nr:hypothetical protein [Sphingomonas sp.]MBA4761142.1 hypothetical protein [Sphingomonas sp.]
MTRKIAAESAFQIAMFVGIVTLGWQAGLLLASAGVPAGRSIGYGISGALMTTLFLNWKRLFDHFWPESKQ